MKGKVERAVTIRIGKRRDGRSRLLAEKRKKVSGSRLFETGGRRNQEQITDPKGERVVEGQKEKIETQNANFHSLCPLVRSKGTVSAPANMH